MRNKLLHALSNRSGPFHTPVFGAITDFSPWQFGAGLARLRRIFYLDNSSTDYYLKIYVALLNGYPDLQKQFEDSNATYRTRDFVPRGVRISGGELYSAENMVAYFTDNAAEQSLPVPLTYRLLFKDSQFCLLTVPETGLSRMLNFTSARSDPNKLLHIDWPDDVPFTGPIRLNQNWEQNAEVAIEVEPSQFPFKKLLANIKNEPVTSQLLMDFSLVDEFHGCNAAEEKVALVLALLALSNKSVFP